MRKLGIVDNRLRPAIVQRLEVLDDQFQPSAIAAAIRVQFLPNRARTIILKHYR